MFNQSIRHFFSSGFSAGALARAVSRLLVLFLLAGTQLAQAAVVGNVNFKALTQTTTGGTVAAGAKLTAGLTYTVGRVEYGDAITIVELMEGQTTLASMNWTSQIKWDPDGEYAVEVARQGTLTSNLGVGVHQIYLRVSTSYGYMSSSPAFTVTVTGPAPAPVDGATFYGQNVPATVNIGSTTDMVVSMTNSGNTTWSTAAGYRLGSQNPTGSTVWNRPRVDIAGTVAPGQTYQFNVPITAPATPGTYNMQWQMVRDGVGSFGALSTNVAVTVKSQSTTSLAISNASPGAGESVRLTATVSGYNPTGVVTFTDNGATLANVSVSGGVAVYDTGAMAIGGHTITASYSGDSSNFNSAATPGGFIVRTATGTSVVASNASPTVGASVRLTATVTGSSYLAGTVTFKDGSTVLGVVETASQSSVFMDTSTLGVGPHAITASYSGDLYSQGSTSTASTVNVSSTTQTTLTTNSFAPGAGVAITLTATVSGSNPTGNVEFRDGATVLASIALSGNSAVYSPVLSAGWHGLTARYVGSPTNLTSTSGEVGVTWDRTTATITLGVNNSTPTVGTTVTFTANVAGNNPTGSVTFMDGTSSLGVITVSGGSASLPTSALTIGGHSVTAIYSGDTNNKNATSTGTAVTVFSTSQTTLATSSAAPAAGASVILTATVTGSSPSGNVEFKEGATLLATIALSGNTATYTRPAMSTGLHTLTAHYVGSGINRESWSGNVGVTWDKTNATAAVTVNDSAPNVGTSITFTATISGSSPTGNVTFMDGGTSLGSANVSGGVAYLATSALGVGAHSVTANYSGDANNKSYTSAGQAVNVYSTSSTTLSTSSAAPAAGAAVTLTAAVTGSSPTGDVQFKEGATVLATVPVSGGTAIYVRPAMSTGLHTLTARYVGNPTNRESTSTGVNVTWDKTNATAAIGVSNNAPTVGSAVTFTATIMGSSPTGNVTFMDGGTSLGNVAVSGGVASLPTSALTVGAHSVTAVYSGDANNRNHTSTGVTVNVFSTSTTTLTSSSAAPAAGAAVTLTAAVTGSNPAGDVEFKEGGTLLATVPLSGGTAIYVRPAMSTGLHALTARYVGNATNRESTSANVNVTWDKTVATAALAVSNSSPSVGLGVTLTATIAGNSPTGSVTFMDGNASLGVATISGGVANLSASFMSVGARSVTAVYGGDANNKGVTSTARTVNVFEVTVTHLTVGTATPAAGASVLFTADVVASAGEPTGNIEFRDGTTVLKSVATVGGYAQYLSPALNAGLHTISAHYVGDTTNLPSTSASTNVTWAMADASATLSVSNSAPTHGSTVTFTVAVAGVNPTGTVSFMDGATSLGVATLSGGSAGFQTSSLAVGPHSITAVYSGDVNNTGATSLASAVHVSKVTQTTLSASDAAPAGGVAVTLTAVVAGSSPTGNVEFKDGATVLRSVAVTGGTAIYVTPALSLGLHTLSARYVGDTNNLSSTSADVGVTWAKTSTSTTLNASASTPAQGASVSFTVTIAGSSPSGTVTFMDGAVSLGTATVTNAGATFAISTLATGEHSIMANYSGDAANLASTSAASVVTVGQGSEPSSATPIPVMIDTPYLSNPDAGTLPGDLTVGSSGAASYSIPLVVPPGTAGLQPNLSLNYSGQGPNGRVGLGWSIGGFSSIHRCGKTIAQDRENDRISFATTDRLCLDGQRLVLVNLDVTDANYWAEGAEYRTEIDSFSRITALGALGARSFKVESKDGRISSYGKGSAYVGAYIGPMNSGVEAVTPVPKVGAQSWAIDEITDRAKNYVRFSYEQDTTTGEHRPTFIRYGAVGLPAHAAVQFEHQARDDAWKRYIDETRNDLRTRTWRINTFVGTNLDGDVAAAGTIVREYTLAYEKSPTSGRSLLHSVKACANNPQTSLMECLPETTFTWGKPDKAPGFKSLGMWAGGPVLTTFNPQIFDTLSQYFDADHADYFAFNDFNGDGRGDGLEKRVASVWTPGMANDDVAMREWGNPIPPGTKANQYRYFHNNGTGFETYTYKLSTGEDFVVLDVGDFDGDGALDLFTSTSSGTRICLSPLGNKATPGAPGTVIEFACRAVMGGAFGNKANLRPYIFDAYGDGRSAAYSNINDLQTATFCTMTSCETDSAPPPILGLNVRRTAAWQGDEPEFKFTDLTQMVDFSGIGKPYDTRWTAATLSEVVHDWDAITRHPQYEWVNMQPIITMTSLGAPGTASTRGTMTPYVYPNVPVTYRAGYLFEHAAQAGNNAVDLSGSGYNSLVFGFLELGWDGYGRRYNARSETTLCQSTGRALDCSVRKKYSGDQYRTIQTVGNFVGDGQAAILVRPLSTANSFTPRTTGALEMCRVMGEDTTDGVGVADNNIVCVPWTGVDMPSDSSSWQKAGDQVYFMDLLGTGRQQMVYYHRGHHEKGIWIPGAGWELFEPIDVAATGEALDRIVSVSNGLGATAKVEYVDGLTSGVVSKSGNAVLSYPLQPSSPAGKIVRKLTVSNGIAADRSKVYSYQDAATDVSGRGSLGYRVVTEKDEQTNSITTSTFAQAWPHTGMQIASMVVAGNGVLLSDTSTELGTKLIPQVNGVPTIFAYVAGSSVCRRDLNGDELGRSIASGKDSAAVQYDNWGNLLNSKTSLQSCSEDQAAFSTSVVNTYWPIDIAHWLVGQVQRNITTKYQRADGTSLSRTLDFGYEPNFSGKVLTTTQEPSDVKLLVTTTFGHNEFGLVNSTEIKWTNPADAPVAPGSIIKRTSLSTYDQNGRYLESVTNALGHKETHEHYPSTGVLSRTIDRNGLSTTWQADGFGRAVRMTDAVGNEARTYVKKCQGGCPLGASIVRISETFHGTDRIAVPKIEYLDTASRVLRSQTWGRGARMTVLDQRYDGLGRLEETDHPRFINAASYRASRQYYDELNRVWKTVTQGEDGTDVTTTTSFRGLATDLTNARGNTRIETRNVAGQLKSVVDTAGNTTQFGYDPFANLVQTIDPNGNVISVAYDSLGRKTDLIDPDLGWISYKVDPAGQVYEQVSPKQRVLGQKATFVFDELGRMIERNETDLHGVWIFDTAIMGKGQLAETYTGSAISKTYQRTHEYDILGRPSRTTQLLTDGSYTAEPEYDVWGRLISQAYRRGGSAAKVFAQRYDSMGALSRIERGSLVLWQVNDSDAAGRLTEVVLGNGLKETQSFNRHTGRLDGSALDTTGGEMRLTEGYEYDAIGSVRIRSQYWSTSGFQENLVYDISVPHDGFRETFTYDKLNRIETSKVDQQALQEFKYDDTGNMLSKTGVGTGNYQYPVQGPGAVRPHAVTNIPGIGQFLYDDNGNLISSAQRTVAWTSFDMPSRIEKANVSATFVYGPEHQRTRQNRSDGSQVVYAGAQEIETKAGQTTIRTYWPGGIGLEVDKPSGITELNWTHKDKLGSPIGQSDQNGTLREKMAYDAWGKRRTLAGAVVDGTPVPDNIDGVVDNRGYTGHEMLDQLELVHMNGRVYDPMTTRFMSADPLISDPLDGQNYNRYSYVLNNPTNITDPTGFDPRKDGDNKEEGVPKSIGQEIAENLANGKETVIHASNGTVTVSAKGETTYTLNGSSEIFSVTGGKGVLGALAANKISGVGAAAAGVAGTKAWELFEQASAERLEKAGYTVAQRVRLTWEGAKGAYVVMDAVGTKGANIVMMEAKDGLTAKLSKGQKLFFEAAFKSKDLMIMDSKVAARLALEEGVSLAKQGMVYVSVDTSVMGARGAGQFSRVAANAAKVGQAGFVTTGALATGVVSAAWWTVLLHHTGLGGCDSDGKCSDTVDGSRFDPKK